MTWRNPFKAGKTVKEDLETARQVKIAVKVHHERALERQQIVDQQAATLDRMNHRNHYSESLTDSFLRKGRPA